METRELTLEELRKEIVPLDELFAEYGAFRREHAVLVKKYQGSLRSLRLHKANLADSARLVNQYKTSSVTLEDYQALEATYDAITKEYKNFQNEHNDYVNSAAIQYQNACQQFNDEIASLKVERDVLRDKCEESTVQEKSVVNRRQSRGTKSFTKLQLQQAYDEVVTKCGDLELQNLKQCELSVSQNTIIKVELEKAQEELKHMNLRLQSIQIENERYKAENKDLKEQNRQYASKSSTLHNETDLVTKCSHLELQILKQGELSVSQNTSMKIELERAREELNHMNLRLLTIQIENEQYKADNKDLIEQNRQYARESSTLQHETAELFSETNEQTEIRENTSLLFENENTGMPVAEEKVATPTGYSSSETDEGMFGEALASIYSLPVLSPLPPSPSCTKNNIENNPFMFDALLTPKSQQNHKVVQHKNIKGGASTLKSQSKACDKNYTDLLEIVTCNDATLQAPNEVFNRPVRDRQAGEHVIIRRKKISMHTQTDVTMRKYMNASTQTEIRRNIGKVNKLKTTLRSNRLKDGMKELVIRYSDDTVDWSDPSSGDCDEIVYQPKNKAIIEEVDLDRGRVQIQLRNVKGGKKAPAMEDDRGLATTKPVNVNHTINNDVDLIREIVEPMSVDSGYVRTDTDGENDVSIDNQVKSNNAGEKSNKSTNTAKIDANSTSRLLKNNVDSKRESRKRKASIAESCNTKATNKGGRYLRSSHKDVSDSEFSTTSSLADYCDSPKKRNVGTKKKALDTDQKKLTHNGSSGIHLDSFTGLNDQTHTLSCMDVDNQKTPNDEVIDLSVSKSKSNSFISPRKSCRSAEESLNGAIDLSISKCGSKLLASSTPNTITNHSSQSRITHLFGSCNNHKAQEKELSSSTELQLPPPQDEPSLLSSMECQNDEARNVSQSPSITYSQDWVHFRAESQNAKVESQNNPKNHNMPQSEGVIGFGDAQQSASTISCTNGGSEVLDRCVTHSTISSSVKLRTTNGRKRHIQKSAQCHCESRPPFENESVDQNLIAGKMGSIVGEEQFEKIGKVAKLSAKSENPEVSKVLKSDCEFITPLHQSNSKFKLIPQSINMAKVPNLLEKGLDKMKSSKSDATPESSNKEEVAELFSTGSALDRSSQVKIDPSQSPEVKKRGRKKQSAPTKQASCSKLLKKGPAKMKSSKLVAKPESINKQEVLELFGSGSVLDPSSQVKTEASQSPGVKKRGGKKKSVPTEQASYSNLLEKSPDKMKSSKSVAKPESINKQEVLELFGSGSVLDPSSQVKTEASRSPGVKKRGGKKKSVPTEQASYSNLLEKSPDKMKSSKLIATPESINKQEVLELFGSGSELDPSSQVKTEASRSPGVKKRGGKKKSVPTEQASYSNLLEKSPDKMKSSKLIATPESINKQEVLELFGSGSELDPSSQVKTEASRSLGVKKSGGKKKSVPTEQASWSNLLEKSPDKMKSSKLVATPESINKQEVLELFGSDSELEDNCDKKPLVNKTPKTPRVKKTETNVPTRTAKKPAAIVNSVKLSSKSSITTRSFTRKSALEDVLVPSTRCLTPLYKGEENTDRSPGGEIKTADNNEYLPVTKRRIAHTAKVQKIQSSGDSSIRRSPRRSIRLDRDQLQESVTTEQMAERQKAAKKFASSIANKSPERTAFKRPLCKKRNSLIQSPASPEPPKEVVDVPTPKIIPLEKIPVTPVEETIESRVEPLRTVPRAPQMSVERGKALLAKMLQFYEDENIKNVARAFLGQSPEFVVKLVLEQALVDKQGDSATRKNRSEPVLTTTQQALLKLMVALEKLGAGKVRDVFMNEVEGFLPTVTDPVSLWPITRLYVAVCKHSLNMWRARKALCNSFASMHDLAVPFIFITLQSWLEVMPCKDSPLHGCLFTRAIMQLILLKGCGKQGYNLVNLRQLLMRYYGYSSEVQDSKELLMELFKRYIEDGNECLETLALALSRTLDQRWVFNQIDSKIKPKIQEANVYQVCTVLKLVTSMTRYYSKTLDPAVIENNRRWLNNFCDGPFPDCVRDGAMSALARLSTKL